MTKITFPSILKSERIRLGWTRKKMSEVTGIPARTIETWENGKEPAKYIQRYVLQELRFVNRDINPVGLLNQIEQMRADCTPSGETKAIHIGEYEIPFPMSGWDEDGEHSEWTQTINVPWTTVKEIMKRISKNWRC